MGAPFTIAYPGNKLHFVYSREHRQELDDFQPDHLSLYSAMRKVWRRPS